MEVDRRGSLLRLEVSKEGEPTSIFPLGSAGILNKVPLPHLGATFFEDT